MQGGGEGQIGIRVVVLGVNAARKAAYDAQHAFDQVNKSLGASALAAEAFDRKLARLGANISTLGRNLSFSLTIPLTLKCANWAFPLRTLFGWRKTVEVSLALKKLPRNVWHSMGLVRYRRMWSLPVGN